MADMLNYLAYAKMMEQPDLGNTFATGLKAGSDVALTQTKNAIAQQGLAEERAFQEAAASGDWEKAAAINPQKYWQYQHGKSQAMLGEHYKTLANLETAKADKENQLSAIKYLNNSILNLDQTSYRPFWESAKNMYPQYIGSIPHPDVVDKLSKEDWQYLQSNIATGGKAYEHKLKSETDILRSHISGQYRVTAAGTPKPEIVQEPGKPPTYVTPTPGQQFAPGTKFGKPTSPGNIISMINNAYESGDAEALRFWKDLFKQQHADKYDLFEDESGNWNYMLKGSTIPPGVKPKGEGTINIPGVTKPNKTPKFDSQDLAGYNAVLATGNTEKITEAQKRMKAKYGILP